MGLAGKLNYVYDKRVQTTPLVVTLAVLCRYHYGLLSALSNCLFTLTPLMQFSVLPEVKLWDISVCSLKHLKMFQCNDLHVHVLHSNAYITNWLLRLHP